MTRSARRLGAPLAAAVLALLLGSSRPARAADLWQPLGPSGGEVAVLAVDPANGDTVYAGAQLAGVFRSANGGRSWQPSLAGQGVSQIAVSPGTRTVYAFSGDFFRSRDRGVSWVSLAPALAATGKPFAGLSLAVSPAPGTVFALALSQSPADAVVVRSTDDGDSWRVVFTPPGGASRVWADPTDPHFVYATAGDGTYLSADGGTRWTLSGLGFAATDLAIEAGPRHRLLAYRDELQDGVPVRSHLAASSDRGRTWRSRDTLGGRRLVFLRSDPAAPGVFVAGSYGGALFRTTDAGLHWTSLGATPFDGSSPYRAPRDLAFDPHRPGVALLAVPGGDLGRTVWKTASYGAAWTPFVRGLFAGSFTAVAVDPRTPANLWAAADPPLLGVPSGLWQSADRGATWTAAGFVGQWVDGVTFGARGDRLFAFLLQEIDTSDDGGRHWAPFLTVGDRVGAFVNPPEEPDTFYVLARSRLWVSRDGGATWTSRPLAAGVLAAAPGSPATLYSSLSAPGLLYPLVRDRVQRSADRGETWTTILPSFEGTVAALAVDPADPQRLVVGRYRPAANERFQAEILTTADGGATWSPGVLPAEDLPFLTFSFAPILPDPLVPHGFLASTSLGVYASADGGATWSRLGEGLPRIPAVLGLDPSSPQTLYAATQGGGIYRLERTEP